MSYLIGLAVLIFGIILSVLGGSLTTDPLNSYLSAINFSIIFLSAVISTCTVFIIKAIKNK